MSIRVSQYYWEESEQRGTAKLCLLALADFADAQGVACPGVDRLAQRCGCSPRTIQRTIRRLEAAGEVYTVPNGGFQTAHGRTNRYLLLRYREAMGLGPGVGVTDRPAAGPAVAPDVTDLPPPGTTATSSKPSEGSGIGIGGTRKPDAEEGEESVAEQLHVQTFGKLAGPERSAVRAFHAQHSTALIRKAYQQAMGQVAQARPIAHPVRYVGAILRRLAREGAAGAEPAPERREDRVIPDAEGAGPAGSRGLSAEEEGRIRRQLGQVFDAERGIWVFPSD